MALMMGRLYAALRAADVPDDKAIAAAEEVAEFKDSISGMRTDLAVLKGMVGLNLAFSLAILAKLFLP